MTTTPIIAYRPHATELRKRLHARFARALQGKLQRAGFVKRLRIKLRIEEAIDRIIRRKYPPSALYARAARA